MKTAFFIAALLAPLPAVAGDAIATVPEQFVGHWAGSPGACGSIADDLALRITPRHLTYWESEGPIKAAVVRQDTEIALITELSGEGETWLSTAKFTLSDDGHQLIDSTTLPGQELVRYRCPDAVGSRSSDSIRPKPPGLRAS